MWIMFLVVMSKPNTIGYYDQPIAVQQVEFSSREKCLHAVQFSRKRPTVQDAWCVPK